MYKEFNEEERYYQQRSMRASGLIQAIWQSGNVPKEEAFAIDYVENMFKSSVKIIEAYVIKEPFKPAYQLGSPPSLLPQNQHLSDENVAAAMKPPYDPNVVPKQAQKPWENRIQEEKELRDLVTNIIGITEKEYKPKKFRYGIKDNKGTWYSTFFKQHYLNAQEAKNTGKQARILFEVGEYNGKPQYTIQSLDVM